MEKSAPMKVLSAVSISLEDEVLTLERLRAAETGQEQVRLSIAGPGATPGQPLNLTEDELIDLLQAAIHAGVLSGDFLSKLRAFFEI
jgi:hypothetical protein